VTKFRKKIVAGNWKMNKGLAEAESLAAAVRRDLADCRDVEIVLCPPFTALKAVGETIADSNIKLGAQNMHWEKDGAFTGEISGSMLRDLFCHYVILGHSERRAYFGETDEMVNRKVQAALAQNLTPIVCVGETLKERDAGKAQEVVQRQVEHSLRGLNAGIEKIVLAYEPVWAIGTGRTATPDQAQEMHAFIRGILGRTVSGDTAAGVRILYGGSVKPANARDLFRQPDIDGGLIGGASLEAHSFVEIARAAV
jgi:triosephosphate isomerase